MTSRPRCSTRVAPGWPARRSRLCLDPSGRAHAGPAAGTSPCTPCSRPLALLPEDAPERAELRRQAIEDNIAFAARLARRFRDRGEPVDDLTQVAMVGLVNAVDGYDPTRGCEFAGYATPTIVGEIRRYFRDKGWRIKVPRRLQELRLQVNRAKVELSQTLAASPTSPTSPGTSRSQPTRWSRQSRWRGSTSPLSLSARPVPTPTPDVSTRSADLDPGMEAVENRESVKPLLATLPERERRILTMRFFGDMTQSQIAAELGISQMHVSRLLAQTLATPARRPRRSLSSRSGSVGDGEHRPQAGDVQQALHEVADVDEHQRHARGHGGAVDSDEGAQALGVAERDAREVEDDPPGPSQQIHHGRAELLGCRHVDLAGEDKGRLLGRRFSSTDSCVAVTRPS